MQIFLHFREIAEGSLRAYIGTVAKHKAIDYARRLGNAGAHLSGDGELPEEEALKLRAFLESIGDSVVLVVDDGMTKIHVHTN
ncbi:MAG: hypothetical protein IJ236_08540, partial [Oscillospiraceae bacterium]|nr:hypothetical protein [Oscillospiraceae bacterium]